MDEGGVRSGEALDGGAGLLVTLGFVADLNVDGRSVVEWLSTPKFSINFT